MDKIIFLDIDGVLKTKGDGFDKVAVDNLINIINRTGCKIVISSNWRVAGIGINSPVQKYLRDSGGGTICQHIIGMTDLDGYNRGIQIKQWLIDNDFSGNFVVIDDIVWDMGDIKDCIWVDKDLGLTADDADMAVYILNKGD